MTHQEIPGLGDGSHSADQDGGYLHFKSSLRDLAEFRVELRPVMDQELRSLGNLRDSQRLNEHQSVAITTLLHSLSSADVDAVHKINKITHRLVFYDSPVEWSKLESISRFLPEIEQEEARELTQALVTLCHIAPDQETFNRALDTFERLLQYSKEHVKDIIFAVKQTGAFQAFDESIEAEKQRATLRIAFVEKALQKRWDEDTITDLVNLIPPVVSKQGQQARLISLVEFDLPTPVVERYFHWIESWDTSEFLQQKDRAATFEALFASPSRAPIASALCEIHRFTTKKSSSQQVDSPLANSLQLQGSVLDLFRQANKEGRVSEQILSNSALLDSARSSDKQASFSEMLSEIYKKVFLDRIPVAVTTIHDGTAAKNFAATRDELAPLIDSAQQEMERLVFAVLRFEERVAALDGNKFSPANFRIHLSSILDPTNRRLILLDAQAREKLIVCLAGRGLNQNDGLVHAGQFTGFIRDLKANVRMLEIINERDMKARQALLAIYVDEHQGDNPPFSIDGMTAKSTEVQARFSGQIFKVLARQQDGYFGAWANTFEFRHTPIGQRCPFDEMAASLDAKLFVVPAADFNRFPGRGRVITNIDIERIFPGDPHAENPYGKWESHTLAAYGPVPRENRLKLEVAPPDRHALSNLGFARITATRAFFAISVPNNPFMELNGENMTYIEWNHHFDATGICMASLVPTRALHAIMDPVLIPYDPAEEAFPYHSDRDIADTPPTIDAIRNKAQELGCTVGVVNLSAGSNISGGLCDGFDHGSSPYRSWERHSVNQDYLDGFGMSHKFHINNDQSLTLKMWDAHERVYEITTSLQNVRDVFKIAAGRDARGDTRRLTISDTTEVDSDYSGRNPGRIRKLQLLAEYISESREKGLPPATIPALVLAPVHRWAAPVSGPIVIDGYTSAVFQDPGIGKPFVFEVSDGVLPENLLRWWEEQVDPVLDKNPWIAPRLVAREKCFALMKKFGFKG